jgi:hypothetical protein
MTASSRHVVRQFGQGDENQFRSIVLASGIVWKRRVELILGNNEVWLDKLYGRIQTRLQCCSCHMGEGISKNASLIF